jgi:hypothetical protein
VPEDPGRFPGGYVTIKGEFIKEHRDEIIAVINSKEDREKAEHPLQRIMAIEDVSGACRSPRPTRTWHAGSAKRCTTRTRAT